MIAMNVPLWFEKLIWKRCVCVGTEGIWARSVLSFSFAVDLKLPLKKKSLKNKRENTIAYVVIVKEFHLRILCVVFILSILTKLAYLVSIGRQKSLAYY